MHFKIVIIALFFFSECSWAGNEVGNGGVGFNCSKKNEYFILDFFEHNVLNPGNKIIHSEKDYRVVLEERLKLLEKLDSKQARFYEKQIAFNFKEIKFLDGIVLNKTQDSMEIIHPEHCELVQFAVQKKQDSTGKTDIFINKTFWEKLDNTNKAGLILHEMIYEQFAELGEKNSLKVRKYNAYIFSETFKSTTLDEYQKFVRDLKVSLY